jgi:hypothetical protein
MGRHYTPDAGRGNMLQVVTVVSCSHHDNENTSVYCSGSERSKSKNTLVLQDGASRAGAALPGLKAHPLVSVPATGAKALL